MVCTISNPQHRTLTKMSREPWPHPYLSELPLLHGEKFLTTVTMAENLESARLYSEHSNYNLADNMIKVEVIDPEELASVNPHDIYHPVYPQESLISLNILVSSSQLQDQDSFDATVYSAKSECPTPVGDCYDSSLTDSSDTRQRCSLLQPQSIDTSTRRSQSVDSCSLIGPNSLRMEEFQDLDPGLEQSHAEFDLNTPVFEKSNPFDVDLTATVKSLSQSSIISNNNNINQQQSTNSNSYMFNYVIKDEPMSDRSWFLDNLTEPSYTINVNSSNSDNIFSEAGSSFLWPSALKASSAGKTFIHEDDQTSSDNVNKINVLDEFIIRARDSYEEEFETSMFKRECFSSGSSECSVDAASSVPPRLVLPELGTIPNIFGGSNNAVSTPDVITTIEEIEADHKHHGDSDEFNILQFISEQDIITSSNIIESFELPSAQHNIIPEAIKTNSNGRSRTSSKSSTMSRRKRNSYDDDEEYMPPSKIRLSRVTNKPKTLTEYESDLEQLSSSDNSDSSDSDESVTYEKNKSKSKKRRSTSTKTNVVRRGRPVGSKQSTTNAAPGDKYREMRDKNNEASRKSRLKKKQQDSHYFVELDDLEHHNIQLKARVSELQKTVDTFRANLMKVMLSK